VLRPKQRRNRSRGTMRRVLHENVLRRLHPDDEDDVSDVDDDG